MALVLSAGFSVSGTVVPRLSLHDLARNSAVVVHGRILSRKIAWDASPQFLWTHYSLEVIDPLKGSSSGIITISEPGGTLEGISMQIAGVVGFAPQDEVVVFLHRTPIGYWRTSGYNQGKFSVVQSSGGPKVRTSVGGMALVGPAERRGISRAKSDLALLDGLSLAEFKSQVRKAVNHDASR